METPVVLINQQILENNLAQMAEKVANAPSTQLRPHIKTHKNPELAKRQLAYGAVGITVAKLGEAEVMIDGGIRNIFLAYPLVSTDKINRGLALAQKSERFIFSVDTVTGAEQLNRLAEAAGISVEVRLEINTGLARTGVELEEALPFAKTVSQFKQLNLTGIYTYRGSKLLDGTATKDAYSAGIEEGTAMVTLAKELRAAGIQIEDVSVGSSLSIAGVLAVEGVTEVRPGTYVFNDAMQLSYGVCHQVDCAATVLVTVVSRHGNRLIIDGGSKAFATDVQPTIFPTLIRGFGQVKGYPKVIFERMNEEHGVLLITDETIQVGDRLEIIPNHICSTINLYDVYYLDQQAVSVAARGKTQ
ncbi:alanine racemase [Vagococcus sp. BWB3-3]|uniref:Alanine racemase n=1 Tax=Vagococcus allomyrinae TaxID=2794353 RepID=A0A940SVQ7_9ENTE|nr:alanine racemase [Vagococcus allomyrinae]MBP1042570.1 alanine racemase [Vagococcus allomyrinae]